MSFRSMPRVTGPPAILSKPLKVPKKILMGPGPSNCSERVLRALGQQVIGHLHPEMLEMMDEIKAGLRYVFQTENRLTLALSASGHAGMEACLGNLFEPGETVLIVKSGIWGERAKDMTIRLGLHWELLEIDGRSFTLRELEDALRIHRPTGVFVVHSESSTGIKQDLEGVGNLVHRYGGLLIVDAVASLGAEPFFMDAWEVDALYTGSQKVLGAPPGITPISFSPRAEKKILNRKYKIPVFYWDMTLLADYWNCFGNPRVYHHTISATLVYGLREALAEFAEEGLQNSWKRHAEVSKKLLLGLEARGFRHFVSDPKSRLSTITTITVPPGIDGKLLIQRAMEKFKVEISGGLGPTAGKILRIGLMGNNATSHHVDLVLRALDDALLQQRQIPSKL